MEIIILNKYFANEVDLMAENYKALTIAGSDTSGGAGMEADLKTFEEMGVYGMVVLTVIVAQNPKDWAHDIFPIELDTVKRQLATVGDGIGINAMKTGMLSSAKLVDTVEEAIKKYNFKNVVIDPVMVCKGIDAIMVPEAAKAIKAKLIPFADVVTPNTVEAAYIADMEKVETVEDIKEACIKINKLGAKNIIIKSGSRVEDDYMVDVLFDGKDFTIERKLKQKNIYNSGAGCTFSAAITAGLAKGLSVNEAFKAAQNFIDKAVANSFKINEFTGALAHWKTR